MISIDVKYIYIGLLLFILSSQRCWSADSLSVKCMIINLEYVECTWYPKASKMNYTFSSAFLNNSSFKNCPEYILEHSYTVGCRIPLKSQDQRLNKFFTNISSGAGGNQSTSQVFESLKKYVQLNPPYNVSVTWDEQNSTLLLQWKNSTSIPKCVVYMVRYLIDTNIHGGQTQYSNVTETSFRLHMVSKNKRYVFNVRSTVNGVCGPSDYWSNWSAPLEWGGTGNSSRPGWWQGLFGILPVILLFLLVVLLCYCERIKIILLPVVPDPSKNLQDLFHKHDGNVESWVHISRELKEAFEPDYTEHSCEVCEVTPPCEVSPTPVASTTSQTDNCDGISTEEHPTEQPGK
ncbi:interleukin 2 receptor, gamma b [Myxocyprinus asiaticus]|uniref:interleukin 2 receptor, gamma b n=1 Tax=Myxocyprinus asiaticus TaxID=70543 RepID=UPI0022231BC1|nr:interleukin 2 receptor, gamma b [Myxocyprinus asiaticus]